MQGLSQGFSLHFLDGWGVKHLFLCLCGRGGGMLHVECSDTCLNGQLSVFSASIQWDDGPQTTVIQTTDEPSCLTLRFSHFLSLYQLGLLPAFLTMHSPCCKKLAHPDQLVHFNNCYLGRWLSIRGKDILSLCPKSQTTGGRSSGQGHFTTSLWTLPNSPDVNQSTSPLGPARRASKHLAVLSSLEGCLTNLTREAPPLSPEEMK